MVKKRLALLAAGLTLVVGGIGGLALARGASAAVDYSHLPLSERFERGATWEEFLEAHLSAPEEWRERYDTGTGSVAVVLPEVLADVRSWRLLVVAEAWCGDSRESLPYLARLAAEAPNLELRVLTKSEGRDLLAANPAEGGRTAIPLVLVLDEASAVRGAWIEQPEALRRLIEEEAGRGDADRLLELIEHWRDEDQGRAVLTEVVRLIATAGA